MDAGNAEKMLDLYGGSDSGSPVAPSGFGDTLKKVAPLFSGIPAPRANPNKEKSDAELAKAGEGLKDLESFKTTPPPPPPDLSKLKPVDENFSSPFDAFKSVMPVFTIFASLASRHPLQTAMTSMAASMDAFHKGEIEKFQQERENSKAQLDYATAVEKQNHDYYQAVHDNEKLSIEEKFNLIKTHAAMAQDYLVAGASGYKDQMDYIRQKNEQVKSVIDVAEKVYKTDQAKSGAPGQKYDFSGLNKEDVIPGTSATMGEVDQLVESRHSGASMADLGISTRTTKNPLRDAFMQRYAEKYPDDNIYDIKTKGAERQVEAKLAAKNFENMDIATTRLDKSIPLLLEKVQAMDLGNFKTWNEFENFLYENASDPKVIPLIQTIEDTRSDFEVVQAKGGEVTDKVRNRSDKILNAAWGKGGIKAATDTMLQTSANQTASARESLGRVNNDKSEVTIPANAPTATNDKGEKVTWNGTAWVK